MAILDTSLILSNAQAITTTAYSENVIDLGTPDTWNARSGQARELPINLDITEDFDASGGATLTIVVLSGTSATAGSGTVTTHYSSSAIPKASLLAAASLNALFRLFVPHDARRYLYLQYVVATGPMTAGKITATAATAVRRNIPV